MLFADKRNLETNLQVSLLKIREKELQFYVQNCIASALRYAMPRCAVRKPTPPASTVRSGHSICRAGRLRLQWDNSGRYPDWLE